MEQIQEENKSSLIMIGDLLKSSWNIFSKRFWVLVGIMAIPVVAFGFLFLLGILIAAILGEAVLVIIIPLAVILGLIFIVISAWAGLALIWAIKERETKAGIKECFKGSSYLLPSYIWIYILHLVIVGGGFLLLGVPGIIFSVWFAFGYYVLVVEEKKGMNALIRSRDLVKGYWWQALGRLLVVFAIAIATASLVNLFIVGIIVQFLVSIFSVIYVFILFESFRELKEEEPFETPSAGRKAKFILVGVLGFVFVTVMIAAMFKTILPLIKSFMQPMDYEGLEMIELMPEDDYPFLPITETDDEESILPIIEFNDF